MLLAGIQYCKLVKESWIPDQVRNDGLGVLPAFTSIRDEPHFPAKLIEVWELLVLRYAMLEESGQPPEGFVQYR